MLSLFVSMFLIAVLICLWWLENIRPPTIDMQLTRLEGECKDLPTGPRNCSVKTWLDENWSIFSPEKNESSKKIQIPTGIFIQALKFESANEVNLNGYLWQKFSLHDLNQIGKKYLPVKAEMETQKLSEASIRPPNLVAWQKIREEGFFIFPEEVSSSSSQTRLEDEIWLKDKEEVLFIWYFDTTLRQRFIYDKYPFDTKEIWVKIWPRDFGSGLNLILIPDLASYKNTTMVATFGIEKEIVSGSWNRKNTFFDYECSSYDTTFGVNSYKNFVEKSLNNFKAPKEGPMKCWWTDGQKPIFDEISYQKALKCFTDPDCSFEKKSHELRFYPTLRYNIVVKRKFENAFIVNFIPLFVVATLLFGLTMMITNNPEKNQKFGLSTSSIIASCSALFFTVMLSHIQLREQFEGGVGIVYMEYFYFLMYFVIMLVAINSYLFSVNSSSRLGIISFKDNLIPKVVFWPTFLWAMVIITLLAFEYFWSGIAIIIMTLSIFWWGVKTVIKHSMNLNEDNIHS